jgi:hypothetical protein
MSAVESSCAGARLSWLALLVLACAMLGSACSSNNTTTTTTTPTTTSGPTTETLNGVMAPSGFAVRTFNANNAGTVSVTLSAIQPALTVGLGVGIHGASGSDCKFSQTVNATAGTTAQISVSVDPGTYCAGAYDIGTLTQTGAVVTISISHP